MDAEIRDGVPTVDEIRQAAKLLQIPLDEERMGFAVMTEERQVTCLLAVVQAWMAAYSFVHDLTTDPLTPEEMYRLVVSAQTEVTDGVPEAVMNAAIWHVQWAGYLTAEVGRGGRDNPNNPAPAIENLLRASARILTTWRDVMDPAHGFEVDGVKYSTGDGTQITNARKEVVAALSAINKLVS